MALAVDHAHFIAIWMEAILYGFDLILFFACFWVLFFRPVNGNRQIVILSATTLMFILNTIHVAGTFAWVEEGFFTADDRSAFFNNRKNTLNLLNKSVYGAVLLVGDGLLIYRCWILWAKNLVVITAPSILLVGTAVTGWWLVYDFSKLGPSASVFIGQAKIMTPLTFILSLFTNLVTTALMVWRISTVSNIPSRNRRDKGSAYRRTIAVMVESGALVPVILLVTLGIYLSGLNEEALFTGPMSQIIGIVPTLTLLQVRLGYSQYDTARGSRNSRPSPVDPEGTVVGNDAASIAARRRRGHSMAHSTESSTMACLNTERGLTGSLFRSPAGKYEFESDQGHGIEMQASSSQSIEVRGDIFIVGPTAPPTPEVPPPMYTSPRSLSHKSSVQSMAKRDITSTSTFRPDPHIEPAIAESVPLPSFFMHSVMEDQDFPMHSRGTARVGQSPVGDAGSPTLGRMERL